MTDLVPAPDADVEAPDCVLGVVRYATRAAGPDLVDGHVDVDIHATRTEGQSFREVWMGTGPVRSGRRGGLVYAHDGNYLFCSCRVPASTRYRQPVRRMYRQLLDLLDELRYPHLFRIWNHVSDINAPNADGLEVYRDFCLGRAEAFEAVGSDWTTTLPAATGIGALGGGIVLYCLASRANHPTHFENPRQVPAYHYPRRYGPRPPAFARASLIPAVSSGGETGVLYVSGTASVVGHETVHVGDSEGQFDTTLKNIEHLLRSVSGKMGTAVDLGDFQFAKAYVRHQGDVAFVQERLRGVFGPGTWLQMLNVDICRSDFLLEVEGILRVPVATKRGWR